MKNALNNQVDMFGDMILWLVANLKQRVIYFIKQGGGNHKIAWVYLYTIKISREIAKMYMYLNIIKITREIAKM